MRKALLVGTLVVVAVACSDGAGELLRDAGQAMMDAGNGMAPDAGAQTGECPCEAGPQGEPGQQGEPGPQGSSGIVAATSFLGQRSMDLSTVKDQWRCEFGTTAGEQLVVSGPGQRVLISGQGSVVTTDNTKSFEHSVAWREAGDSTNGTLGHFLECSFNSIIGDMPVNITELTPTLPVGTYEFGVCIKNTSRSATQQLGARRLYGTALVINSGT